MLDRAFIRSNPELVIKGAQRKGVEAPVDQFLEYDRQRRDILAKLETLRADLNKQSKAIGQLMAQGDKDQAEQAKDVTKQIKDQIDCFEETLRGIDHNLRETELRIPNVPHETVPDGKSGDDNVVVRQWGEKPIFDEQPKPHWDIANELMLIDFERASKISGSGFAVYTGWGARLQRALISFMVDHQTQKNGYKEVLPPFLVLSDCLVGTGQLPKFAEDLYKADEDLWLIPTAEVPVTNLYREEILDSLDLTLKLAAYSGCFRKEAGAAGKDTRGLLRMHQFDKVELVKFTLPENSYDELESLVQDAESVLQALGLHYQVASICAGDMSFSNAKQYDLELWSPGVGRYLEISSCSNFEDFQARRANIRFKRKQGEKPEFVHILNGSGLATPRLFSAIVETFQQPNGSLLIPEPLRPYLGTDRVE